MTSSDVSLASLREGAAKAIKEFYAELRHEAADASYSDKYAAMYWEAIKPGVISQISQHEKILQNLSINSEKELEYALKAVGRGRLLLQIAKESSPEYELLKTEGISRASKAVVYRCIGMGILEDRRDEWNL